MADPVRPFLRKPDKSLPTLASELWDLIVAYLKQEAVQPLKDLGLFVMWGVAGAFALAIGLGLLLLAFLRALQVETVPHLTGNWSWVPYLLTLIVAGIIVAVTVSRINAAARRKVGR